MRTYPFYLTSDEVLILDGLTVAGMAALSIHNPNLSKEQAAAVLGTGIQYHNHRLKDIDEHTLTVFRGKLKAVIEQRDTEARLGMKDGPPDSDLPSVLRLDWDEGEAIFLAAMFSFCSSVLGSNSDNMQGQIAAFLSMTHHANRLGQDKLNAMLIRFNHAVKAALPNVDFVSLS